MTRLNVIPRHGEWPFLPSIEIIQSDYVDPIANHKYSKQWRDLFIYDDKYKLDHFLFGIVERYIIATKGKAGHQVAWVHRD